ncbi:hypothetical protein [Flaviflexus huanghaiensis]|uniref:hypothetical protein n=1 Tax=Flaviflexus huanghaiensis TaxID=1111473 RepID=UPI0015FD8ABD|nr:hypothetical protein [Flaviflexus huanghaiensis]
MNREEGRNLFAALEKSIRPDFKEEQYEGSHLEINACSEYLFSGNRFDVVIGVWDGTRVGIHVVETKVTAEQGHKQLDRYLEACVDKEFLSRVREDLFPDLPGGVECGADLTYLTVVPEEGLPSGVRSTTFAAWQHSLEEEPNSNEKMSLAALLLRDVLQYLGPDTSSEFEALRALDARTPFAQLRSFVETKPLLERKYTRRAAELLGLELYELSSASKELAIKEPWVYAGSGFELGYTRKEWQLVAERPEFEGFALEFGIPVSSDRLNRGEVKLGFKVAPRPYKPRKDLKTEYSGENLAYFERFRGEFAEKLVRKLGQSAHPIDFTKTNYYMQILKCPISFDEGESIEGLSEKVWRASLVIGKLADAVLAELNPPLRVFVENS